VGGTALKEYYATLIMAKELAIVENNDRGRMFAGLRFEPGRIFDSVIYGHDATLTNTQHMREPAQPVCV
jgi:phage anti-repressor protein